MPNRSGSYEDKQKETSELQPFTFREPPREKERNGALQLFRHYCSTTSMNGFVFFSEERTCIEYVWWSVALILSMCGACYMIYEIYIKWLDSPVIVSFATKNLPISEIPFPAVTVCPIIKIHKSYFNLTRYIKDKYSTEDEATRKEMEKAAIYMGLVCEDYDGPQEDYIDPDDFVDVLHKNTPKFMSNASNVRIGNTEESFSSIFRETYTEWGLCYTANRLRLDEIYRDNVVRNEKHYKDFGSSTWSPSSGYETNPGTSEDYPRRAKGAGLNKGMQLVLFEFKEDNDFHCSSLFEGYSITLHSPARIPRTKEEFVFLPADNAVIVTMSPSFVMTSERVRNYPPEKRDCYFDGEKYLKFFKIYSGKNCELECLTNATLAACDCVEFQMPRENGTKVCGPGKKQCVNRVKDQIGEDVKKRSTREYGIHQKGDNTQSYSCGCLPACTDFSYGVRVEPFNISPKLMDKVKHQLDGDVSDIKDQTETVVPSVTDTQISFALIFFKSDRAETTERSELYGPSDFISNFGGLMGLFNGFSLLSLVEVVYYLTLRIIGNIRLFGYWAGPPDGQN